MKLTQRFEARKLMLKLKKEAELKSKSGGFGFSLSFFIISQQTKPKLIKLYHKTNKPHVKTNNRPSVTQSNRREPRRNY